MELSGKIKIIKDTENVTDSFSKRELVVTTSGEYPQDILVEFVQDKCDLIDPLTVGQDVEISINIRGREWIDPEGVAKYFNSIQGWKIKTTSATAALMDEDKDDKKPF